MSSSSLEERMFRYTSTYASKVPDWDAFPMSRGYSELDRAQIRYVGSGASRKVDAETLPPEHFTVSMIYQPVGKYGASHWHEAEEAFFVLEGVLTVGWEWDGTVITARLGPKDMIVHARNRPHGFRNDGYEPVLCSIMHAKAQPEYPNYTFHPKTHDSEISRGFGATPDSTVPLKWDSNDPRHQEMARHIVRFSQSRPQWHPAGFARIPYIGNGGVPATGFRKDLLSIPKGVWVTPYRRDVEEVYLVLEGCISVVWQENGATAEKRLGPRDVIFTPAGQDHYFQNDGVEDAQLLMVVGTTDPENVMFASAEQLRACR